jgi:cytochrome c oxidase subunit 2
MIHMNKKAAIIAAILVACTGLQISGGAQPKSPAPAHTVAPASAHARPDGQPRVIQIVAHKFAFEPNQITLKKGEPVTIQLTSKDVKHGFYIRGLKVDEEIDPGKVTEVSITPDKSGEFPTICDHLCGLGHKHMKMTVVVEE